MIQIGAFLQYMIIATKEGLQFIQGKLIIQRHFDYVR